MAAYSSLIFPRGTGCMYILTKVCVWKWMCVNPRMSDFFPLKASGKMFFIQIASVFVRRPLGSKNKMNEQTSSNNQVSKTLVNVVFIFLGEQSFPFRVIIVRIVLIFRHPLSHHCFVSHQILGCFSSCPSLYRCLNPFKSQRGPYLETQQPLQMDFRTTLEDFQQMTALT